MIVHKDAENTKVDTRARGYSSRYAPSTPDTAPLAPIIGISESGALATWASAAPTPHRR